MPTSGDTYGARLKRAMANRDCDALELAKACDCSYQTIKNAIRDGNDTPLGTELHERAALYLRVDPGWLHLGNALPLRPGLIGPVKAATRTWYQEASDDDKDYFHGLLRNAVRQLPELKSKRGRTRT